MVLSTSPEHESEPIALEPEVVAAETPEPIRSCTPPAADAEPRKIQLLCTQCWTSFLGWTRQFCPTCNADRPPPGWATLPYTFRNRYLFWAPLGRGGMGAVFLAYDEQQDEPEKKAVAIKVVPQSTSEHVRVRLKHMFEREAAAAAMLAQSPCFVRVTSHDVGVEPAYIVMEHVQWPTLRKVLWEGKKRGSSEQPLSSVKVARIAIALLRGVQIMHFHRIVHRDLKPDNIFIRREGDTYEVKILDFGVWTRDGCSPDAPSRSVTGLDLHAEAAPVGTFSYMSPEQMAGRPVGAASDVHTVGSVIWEMATGTVPYKMRRGDELIGIRQRLEAMQTPPPRPESMPEGLYDLLIKALALDPANRWESADEMRSAFKIWLAEQLLRSQVAAEESGERLEALDHRVQRIQREFRPAGALMERLDQLGDRVGSIRRHADEAEPGALESATERAERNLQSLAREVDAFIRGVEGRLIDSGVMSASQEELQRIAPRAMFSKAAFALIGLAIVMASYVVGLALLPEPARPVPQPRPAVTAAATPAPTLDLRDGHGAGGVSIAWSADGTLIASGSEDMSIAIIRARDGRVLRRLIGHDDAVHDVAFSPNGQLVASAGGDGTVRQWQVHTGRVVTVMRGHTDAVTSVRYSPDGARIASGSVDGTTRLWASGSGRLLRTLRPHKRRRTSPVHAVAFSPVGGLLAAGTANGAVNFFDPLHGALVQSIAVANSPVSSIAFSSDGGRIAVGDGQGASLWHTREATLVARFEGHQGKVTSVALSGDGLSIATGSTDRNVRLFNVATHRIERTLDRGATPVHQVAFSPDSTALAIGGDDRSVAVIEAASAEPRFEIHGRDGSVLALALHPGGLEFASAGVGGTTTIIDADDGTVRRELRTRYSTIRGLRYTPAGDALIVAGSDSIIEVWTRDGWALSQTLDAESGPVRDIAISSDGRWLASLGEDDRIVVFDLRAGRIVQIVGNHPDARTIAFAPDDRALISGGRGRGVWLWNVARANVVRRLARHTDGISSLAFSPDGRLIAAGTEDHLVRLIDVETGAVTLTHRGHEGAVRSVSFSPTGERIASGSADRTVKVWPARDHGLITTLRGHDRAVEVVAYAPDGARLISGSHDSTRRVWKWRDGDSLVVARSPQGWLHINQSR